MPSAVCPHCSEVAFSSADFSRVWTCPYCGKEVIPNAAAESRTTSRDTIVDYYSRFWTVDEP